jgi:Tfp pilus assembly ATPase PilU
VIQTGRREGMQSMDEAVIQLVRDGAISPDDAAPHLSSRDILPSLERLAPPGQRPQAA